MFSFVNNTKYGSQLQGSNMGVSDFQSQNSNTSTWKDEMIKRKILRDQEFEKI